MFTFPSDEIKPNGLSECLYGFLSLPGFTVRHAESVVRGWVSGMLFNDRLVRLNRLFVLPLFCVRRGKARMGRTFTWIESNGFLVCLYCLIKLPLARELLAQLKMGGRRCAINPECLLECGLRFVKLLFSAKRNPLVHIITFKKTACSGVTGVELQDRCVGLNGVFYCTNFFAHNAETVVRLNMVRVNFGENPMVFGHGLAPAHLALKSTTAVDIILRIRREYLNSAGAYD